MINQCFFCDRSKVSRNQYESLTSTDKKNFDYKLTEVFKNLMTAFNIEKKFTNEENLSDITKQNIISENQDVIKQKNNNEYYFNFNNHYPKNLSFIILDLRITLDTHEKLYDTKPGFLPMTVLIEQEELGDEYETLLS